jgi:hypothetical protein
MTLFNIEASGLPRQEAEDRIRYHAKKHVVLDQTCNCTRRVWENIARGCGSFGLTYAMSVDLDRI